MNKSTSTTIRVTLGLASLSLSLMLLGWTCGLIPDDYAAHIRGRGRLCEAMAICVTRMAERNDLRSIEDCVGAIAQRNDDVRSIEVRRQSGEVLFRLGEATDTQPAPADGSSTETRMIVPVFTGSEPWGSVVTRFEPIRKSRLPGWLGSKFLLFLGLVLAGQLLAFSAYLKKVFVYLNPQKVVPGRVRSALDSLAEGLLLLNRDGRIVLANRSFASTVGRAPEDLIGGQAEGLSWKGRTDDATKPIASDGHSPEWLRTLADGQPRFGELVGFQAGEDADKTFVVNASPIHDDQGRQQGVLASFQDVTLLEERTTELQAAVTRLQESAEEIGRQNRELEYIATHDALTGCWNRRSFLERFDALWREAGRDDLPLSCTMVDVDHFKKVNDTHGHLIGDQVLRQVGECLRTSVPQGFMVARYGGEEFAILMPATDVAEATEAAEKLRKAIAALEFPGFRVTASLGVSSRSLDPQTPQHLLDQADKCLYAAKRNGRNQVMRFDTVPAELLVAQPKAAEKADAPAAEASAIPYHAVTALITALAYRHPETAAHSRRVADLSVMVAEGILSYSKCYVLEIAALLHDIGKIGIPDNLLSKQGPLTPEELAAIRRHDRIGVEIINAAFADRMLSNIIELHNVRYQESARRADVPLEARILAVADAYDSITSGGGYRPGRSQREAFAELRRGAGTQFDPEVVERFIDSVRRNQEVTAHQSLGQLSRETALDLGLQIERLMTALDRQDMGGLETLAGNLKSRAETRGVAAVAEKAGDLELAVRENEDLIGILRTTNELIGLCRAAQQPCIPAT